MEARVRIELTNKGFADLSLTTWVPRPIASTVETSGVGLSRRARGCTPVHTGVRERSYSLATVFLRLDLCYNTVHEFDFEPKFDCEFTRLRDRAERF